MLYYRVMLIIVLLMYAMYLDYDHKQVEKRVSFIIQNADSKAKNNARIWEYYKKYGSGNGGWGVTARGDTIVINYDSTYGDGWGRRERPYIVNGRVIGTIHNNIYYR